MALLLDIFGFLSVVLRGLTLAAQAFTIGGIAFIALVWRSSETDPVAASQIGRLLRLSAIGLAIVEIASVLLQAAVLAGTVEISMGDALAADFALAGIVVAAAALAVAALGAGRSPSRLIPLALLGLIILLAQVTTSHAAARIDDRIPLAFADFAHMAGASIWIGGIPYFLIALHRVRDGATAGRIGHRVSLISASAVVLLVAAGLVMAVPYIGSLDAIYGTAYGVMVATKVMLLVGLLFLGGMNFLAVERVRRDPRASILRLRRFAEVEIGIGLTVLFAAASLTSQPPAVDLTQDRASWQEIVERITPQWPRLSSPDHASLALSELQSKIATAEASRQPEPQAYVPGEGVVPPRNAEDIAWSEYNHHWAGILVIAIGLLALLERSGRAAWARHWPLLFLLLAAFLFLRSDPEVWPLGEVGFFASFRDPEVVQHRIFVVLIAAFGIFEWRVRTRPGQSGGTALVFPMITAVGGALLLTHSHVLSNVKDQLLIEITHVPLALAGITAGWARWLELRLEGRGRRIAAWVWPIAFVLVGIILLIYREA